MPANSTGWFFHCLARESKRLGHLYSPGAQCGPWPWFPYALDNGAFSCWTPETNTFDFEKWDRMEASWKRLLFWAQANEQKALWAVVPDVPGNREATLERWPQYAPIVLDAGIPLAVAAQDGMTIEDVQSLEPQPSVVAIGGSTEWKWSTVAMWARAFPRVHVLRCNSPEKLYMLEDLHVESCDGTGWNRGDRKQTSGLEKWARSRIDFGRVDHPLTPFASRATRDRNQTAFA
jgi:hypothetical protein